MKYIYINTFINSVTIKDNKLKTIIKYENIARNEDDKLNSIKLIIFSINKIMVLDKQFYDEEYIFNLTDNDMLKYLKDECDFFYKKVNKDWKYELDNKSLSEIGRLLSLLSRFNFKDINYWIEDKEYKRNEKREKLSKIQSEYDLKIQEYLHIIQNLKDEEINKDICIDLIKKIRDTRRERANIKKQIKKLDRR